jgi:hypothetical protein
LISAYGYVVLTMLLAFSRPIRNERR